jgi:hypothetical protein
MTKVMVFKLREDMTMTNAVLRQMTESGLHVDQGWMAIGVDAELVLDVFRTPELGGGRHAVDILFLEGDAPAWVIEHSLVCLRSKETTRCPWLARVSLAANDAELPGKGRWVLSLSGIDGEIAFWPEDPTEVED